MTRFAVVPATFDHIEPIAKRMRQADVDEIWAAAAVLPRPAIALSLDAADITGTWLIDGVPAAIGGVRDGVVWLLTTDLVDKHQRRFLMEAKRQFEDVKPMYDRLYNWVDARNTRSIRWLKWMGFTLDAPRPYGVFRKPFIRFSWGEH
jgi:hypothetical protein